MDAGIAQQERDRVGADTEKSGMAERQKAGIAEQEIETERGDRRDQAVGQELRLIEPDIEGKQRQRDEHENGRRCRSISFGR